MKIIELFKKIKHFVPVATMQIHLQKQNVKYPNCLLKLFWYKNKTPNLQIEFSLAFRLHCSLSSGSSSVQDKLKMLQIHAGIRISDKPWFLLTKCSKHLMSIIITVMLLLITGCDFEQETRLSGMHFNFVAFDVRIISWKNF